MTTETGSRKAGPILRGAILALLALVLGAYAYRERVQGVARARQDAELRREIDRALREKRALKAELKALENDPVYVESLLRRAKKVGAGEKLVE